MRSGTIPVRTSGGSGPPKKLFESFLSTLVLTSLASGLLLHQTTREVNMSTFKKRQLFPFEHLAYVYWSMIDSGCMVENDLF